MAPAEERRTFERKTYMKWELLFLLDEKIRKFEGIFTENDTELRCLKETRDHVDETLDEEGFHSSDMLEIMLYNGIKEKQLQDVKNGLKDITRPDGMIGVLKASDIDIIIIRLSNTFRKIIGKKEDNTRELDRDEKRKSQDLPKRMQDFCHQIGMEIRTLKRMKKNMIKAESLDLAKTIDLPARTTRMGRRLELLGPSSDHHQVAQEIAKVTRRTSMQIEQLKKAA